MPVPRQGNMREHPIDSHRSPLQFTKETRERAAAILELRRRQSAASTLGMWMPQSVPQRLALESEAEEIFYGGAAGGGKTDLLIGAALTRHRKSIIFRREYPQLREIISRTAEILLDYPLAKYNETSHMWRGLPGSRSLEYGAIQHLKDVSKYQGRPHDLKGFDEITQFLPEQYKFVSGWLRSTIVGQVKRCLCTGNPPTTPEGEWVIVYWRPWLDPQYHAPARPGELRWFIATGETDEEVDGPAQVMYKGRSVTPRSRTFIPARLSDNRYLADSGYDAVLESLPEPLRSQLLFGDFSVRLEGDPWQVIPTEWVILAQERWLAHPNPNTGISRLSVDTARGGRDKTVVQHLYTDWFAPPMVFPGRGTPDGPAVAREVIVSLGRDPDSIDPVDKQLFTVPMNIDILGPGASVFDILKSFGLLVYDIHSGAPSGRTDLSGKLRFANLRAEMFWKFREALDPVYGQGLRLPPDREILADLIAPKWTITTRGIMVEEKEEVKKRLHRSPDKGDAIIMVYIDMETRKRDLAATSQSERTYGATSYQADPRLRQQRDPRSPQHYNPQDPDYGKYRS